MTPFHTTSKAGFCVLKLPCVLKIFSKPRRVKNSRATGVSRLDVCVCCFVLLRWGWVFLERTWFLSGIQFTMHFIEIFVAETKRFVGSTINVVLTRQTCGQRSSRAAESKRRALGDYFSERICYLIFPTSKHVFPPDFAVALRFSKRKYRSCAQT